MRNRDMPATAVASAIVGENPFGKPIYREHDGLSKREKAAIAAMQGILSHPPKVTAEQEEVISQSGMTPFHVAARMAIAHADALFDELDGEGTGEVATVDVSSSEPTAGTAPTSVKTS